MVMITRGTCLCRHYMSMLDYIPEKIEMSRIESSSPLCEASFYYCFDLLLLMTSSGGNFHCARNRLLFRVHSKQHANCCLQPSTRVCLSSHMHVMYVHTGKDYSQVRNTPSGLSPDTNMAKKMVHMSKTSRIIQQTPQSASQQGRMKS